MNSFAPASETLSRTPRTRGRRAFTIIELIVAMGIATVMMFLINQIFFQTTNAVSRGIGLSHIIGESRAISSTLETDFIANEIVKPVGAGSGGGFMFIGFKNYPNIDFANPRRQVGSAIQQNVQSDQMLLTLNVGTQSRTPLTPRNDDTFTPYAKSASTSSAFLWYGHVARLSPNGSQAGELDNPARNRFGHQWIVGRQLMYLDPDVDTAAPVAAYINGLYARDPVVNYTIPTSIIPLSEQRRWMGLSDIIHADLDDYTGVAPDGILTTAAASSDIAYITQAARVAYVTERLRVAATVEPDPTPANSYPSWNLAQTHAAFMSFCSDFQISYAGNFDGGTGIDVDTDVVGTGTVASPMYVGQNVKWYGYPTNDPNDYLGVSPAPTYDPTKPVVYAPNSAGTNVNGGNPGDPIYATQAVLETELDVQLGAPTAAHVDRAIVFRHDATDVTTQWPHLIRIRYRLHDERGEIESTNGLTRAQGIWFEQIVRIQ